MTTTRTKTPPQPAEISDELTPAEWFRGYILLPLSEFGQSLDNPNLDAWIEGFAKRNKDFVGDIEITTRGELKIMAPTGEPGDLHEAELNAELVFHARRHGGLAGGPTSMFILRDGSRLCPDAWWMSAERWSSLPEEARRPFRAVVPDFLVEIASPSNRESDLRDKVRLYLEGGARLVWVINARLRRVTIYRPGAEPETLHDPDVLGGGDVLPGFAFNVRQRIFDNAP